DVFLQRRGAREVEGQVRGHHAPGRGVVLVDEVATVGKGVVDGCRERARPGAWRPRRPGEARHVVAAVPRLDDHRPPVESQIQVYFATEDRPPGLVHAYAMDRHERTILRRASFDDDVFDGERAGRDEGGNAPDVKRAVEKAASLLLGHPLELRKP